MFQEERLVSILKYLQEKKRIEVDEICSLLNISRDTARRDIIKLEQQGTILRTRGGAILPPISKDILNYEQRMKQDLTSKQRIGELAATLIHDGDYLYMDASTTVRHTVEYMTSKMNAVVTNSINTADVLTQKEGIRIHLLGGLFNNEHRFVYGQRAIDMLGDYQFEKAFLGACGITAEGLTTYFEEESFLIRKIIQQSEQIIVLADSTKFGKKLFHRTADLKDIDIIVTNQEPDEQLREQLEAVEVDIMVVGEHVVS
ncbi:DeoR/GlpR family DNA-binding transcription regulator [Paenibacillus sp. L3-i20]|uniref:DeoR/GlpR family DNA-binding transcription regulator n=1 Tax=Paenibacillus sp. L3-i20 TaxID=2905833 RepID=UPI001EDFEA2E|nr:DeoR/GlpR family DNA-binding transcription regulator [Paenibacillus sp. L3-i20]GKU76025.1 HTH-type transcriptional repressor GlcR [Paenibacillus sp. L3-i20]